MYGIVGHWGGGTVGSVANQKSWIVRLDQGQSGVDLCPLGIVEILFVFEDHCAKMPKKEKSTGSMAHWQSPSWSAVECPQSGHWSSPLRRSKKHPLAHAQTRIRTIGKERDDDVPISQPPCRPFPVSRWSKCTFQRFECLQIGEAQRRIWPFPLTVVLAAVSCPSLFAGKTKMRSTPDASAPPLPRTVEM